MERRSFLAVAAAAAVAVTGCLHDTTEPEDGGDGSPPSDEDPLTVTDTSFSVLSRNEAGTENTPSYWYEDDALHVRGVIVGSDDCKTARLADASWDDDREALVVQIDTVDQEDAGDACAEVLTPIEYEATVRYEHPQSEPDLVLEHDGEEVGADEMAPAEG